MVAVVVPFHFICQDSIAAAQEQKNKAKESSKGDDNIENDESTNATMTDSSNPPTLSCNDVRVYDVDDDDDHHHDNDDEDDDNAKEKQQQQKQRKHDFVPLTIDDYLDGCDFGRFPVENMGDASFTGVWESSKTFLYWLEKNPDDVLKLKSSSSLTILEMGSGTGWLGINLARHLQQYRIDNNTDNTDNKTLNNGTTYQVVLSDSHKTGAVQWTEANLQKAIQENYVVANNDGPNNNNSNNIKVIPFDWSNNEHRQRVSTMNDWDLIIGTDLIYSEDGCIHLVKAMLSLLSTAKSANSSTSSSRSRSSSSSSSSVLRVIDDDEERKYETRETKRTRLIYGHTKGRMEDLDQKFEFELINHGLKWNILERVPLPLWNDDDNRTTTIYDIYI